MSILDILFGKRNSDQQKTNAVASQKAGCVCAERIEITSEVLKSINNKFIAFDVETTGLSASTERIVELGAVVFENGEIVDQFSTLVNPGILIPVAASKVNHITNDMLRNAPDETQVYQSFVRFLGDTLQGNTIICAHNAKFDMDFLCAALKRLGYNGRIRYVDTLALSRKCLKLENYKQDTVAASYGIINRKAHRAITDAEVCGRILCELINNLSEENEKHTKIQERALEAKKLSDEELEICAVIQDAIIQRGGNSQWIRFYKHSAGYVDVCNLYTIIKFKFASKGKYIIIPSNLKTPTALPKERCSVSEGGTNNVRMYFSSPYNIEFLGDYVFSAYKEADKSMQLYFEQVNGARMEAEQSISHMTRIPDAEIKRILERARLKNYDAVPQEIDTGRNIKREDVVVNAVHNRCPLSQIKNFGNSDKGFEAGFPMFENAERLRKGGEIQAAILLYDKARAVGYDAPALYEAYAKAFRKIKDYANEIVIVEEFIERNPNTQYGELEARRNKAIELLYNLQQSEKLMVEKTAAKELDRKEKTEETKTETSSGRTIIQMDDAGNTIKEFKTISLASKEVGVSPKSIRDAAKGVQKHAGGFVWKYKDDDATGE